MPSMTRRKPKSARCARASRRVSRGESDRFFRHLVAGMRNGVLAITRDGHVAEINGEAARIFQIKRSQRTVGRHFSEVLAKHPDMVRVLHSASELSHLPNRAELRLKTTGGDRLHAVGRARRARPLERRSDVLQGPHEGRAARRARAPARSPRRARRDGRRHRARSEEPARGHRGDGRGAEAPGCGLARRPVDAERHHHEARWPTRSSTRRSSSCGRSACRSSTRRSPTCCRTPSTWRKAKSRGATISLKISVDEGLPPIHGDHHQLCQLFTNLLINAFEALEGRGKVAVTAREGVLEEDTAPHRRRGANAHGHRGRRGRRAGRAARTARPHLQCVFHNEAAGPGLGLAIVRKVVDAHDGRIDIQTGATARGSR